jgi:hypothetical protein
VGDVDGDGHLDLVSVLAYGDLGTGRWMNIKFGTGAMPDGAMADRSRLPFQGFRPTLADVDGDGVQDVVMEDTSIYLSSRGDARRRSYDAADADVAFEFPDGIPTMSSAGYVNHRRFEAMDPRVYTKRTGDLELVLSGGANGPNGTYDASANGAGYLDFPFHWTWKLGDLNGDGWPEFATSSPEYFGGLDYGIALIFEGGPYIPNDDPTVDVRTAPIDDRTRALSVWPNPAHDVLNMAWRGDIPLARMPSRFEVYDMVGRLVGSGSVESGAPAAVWHCAGLPAGAYELIVRDESGRLVTTITVIKE